MSSSPPAAPVLPVDFGRAANDYGRWRQGFPEAFFERLAPLGIGRAGQRILDLGTGTGLLARAFALRGAMVTGLDPSAPMLAEARRADAAAGTTIEYLQARAEATGLADASFDVVSAATCWHWFDRAAAAVEARRLLIPGGRLLIATLDWHYRPGNLIHETGRLVRRFNPNRSKLWHSFEYPAWTGDLVRAGFNGWELFAFTTTLEYSHAGWRGRVRASNGVGTAMDAPTLAAFDAALAALLAERFPAEPMPVEHHVFALAAR